METISDYFSAMSKTDVSSSAGRNSPQVTAILAAAASWQCACAGQCKPIDAVACLYRQSLDLLSEATQQQHREHVLLRPLTVVVAHQKTAEGQAECAAYAKALVQGDYGGALHHCRRLIELTEARIAAQQRN